MPTEAEIQTAQKAVIHPTYGMSLVTLQMVRAIRLSRPHRSRPGDELACPAGQAGLTRTQQALESLRSSDQVQIAVCLLLQGWEPPWQSLNYEF